MDKVAEKFPATDEPELFTDIHFRVSQDSGDLMAFDDEGKEISRCVVEEWIAPQCPVEAFYKEAEDALRTVLQATPRTLGIIEPYSFVMENESGKHIAELQVVDDNETVILGTSFLRDMEKDLDDFIERLLKE